MEFTTVPKNKSPILTIKRAGRQNHGQWQDFIDREQSSVDHLLQDSFATFCQELENKSSTPLSKTTSYLHHTIGGYSKMRKSKVASPEKYSKTLEDVEGLHLPPGIEELEHLYAPMKNLMKHLPGNESKFESLVQPYKPKSPHKKNEDEESEICSVIIPPPLPPVQSHAILEKSLGHEILPRTPAAVARARTRALPPTLPVRTETKPPKMPHLKHSGIYANLNRSSLMSTGSSEESSSSEVMSPATNSSASEAAIFNFEHRSVSQISENQDSSVASSEVESYMNKNHVIYQDPSAIYDQPQIQKKAKKSSEFKLLMAEVTKKRQFRVGLNLFNNRPEFGIEFLASKGFIELNSESVGKFLHAENGNLSLEKIGDYLGSLQSPFAMKVLSCFMQEFNFSGQRIDKSLRLLLRHVKIPGEAQKIEKIMEVFGKRYGQCNPGFASKLKSADSIVTLAFAVILLNTDLHKAILKQKMSVNDFINNLRGVDAGRDFDSKLLKQIYKGIKKQEFVTGIDHVVQVASLPIINENGKNLNLSEQNHRRLVCLCKLSEVQNIHKVKESERSHQRDLFLFNDILVVTKQTSKNGKNSTPIYTQRQTLNLKGLEVTLFHTPVYQFGIQISRNNQVLLSLNAGSEHDRYKFVMDLQESIYEMDLMEQATKSLSI